MSLISRPDEKKRDAAKLERANQAKPLVESELIDCEEGNNTFSLIVVPNGQLDILSKSVLEILGPYHQVLGGPTNGLHYSKHADQSRAGSGTKSALPISNSNNSQAAVANGPSSLSSKDQTHVTSNNKQSNCSLAAAVPSTNSVSISTADDEKKEVSSSSSNVSSRTLKNSNTLLLSTCESDNTSSASSSSHQIAALPSSSLRSPNLHNKNYTKSHAAGDASKKAAKDEKQILSSISPKPESSSAKPVVKMVLSKHQTVHGVSQKKPELVKYSSVNSHYSNENISSTHAQSTVLASSSDKTSPSRTSVNKFDENVKNKHVVNKSNLLNTPESVCQTKEPTHQTSALAANSSFSCDLPVGLLTPEKQAVPPISSRISAAARAPSDCVSPAEQASTGSAKVSDSSGGQLTEKLKLKLKVQNERKEPTSRNELNEIIKELAELPDPLTAIETPQKMENGFIFSTSGTASVRKSQLEFLNDKSKQNVVRSSESKQEVELEKSYHDKPAELKGNSDAVDIIVNGNVAAVSDDIDCGIDPHVDVENTKTKTTLTDSTYDINSILHGDLDLSDDSDAEPAVEDNPVISQTKTSKFVSPAQGIPVKSVVSPMSSGSSNSGSSSPESSSDEDDKEEDDNVVEEKQGKDVELKPLSDRRSSSGSPISSVSRTNEDAENQIEKTTDEDPTMEPTSPQSSESSKVSNLKNLLQSPKKNSISPSDAMTNPYGSSSMTKISSTHQKDSLPTKIQYKSHSELPHCDTLPFEPQKNFEEAGVKIDNDIDKDSKKFRKKRKKLTIYFSSKNKSQDSTSMPSYELSNKKNQNCNSASEKVNTNNTPQSSQLKQSMTLLSRTINDIYKQEFAKTKARSDKAINEIIKDKTGDEIDKNIEKITSKKNKTHRQRSCSSSNEEIDVVSFTPDAKGNDRHKSSPKKPVNENFNQEICKQLFNGKEDEKVNDNLTSKYLSGKESLNYDFKHHKRKNKQRSPENVSMPFISASKVSSSTRLSCSSKSLMPQNLDKSNSVLEDYGHLVPKLDKSNSPAETAKPSPSQCLSKSPAHSLSTTLPSQSSTASVSSNITHSTNQTGGSQPQIIVQIHNNFVSKKLLKWLKDKKEKRKKLHKNLARSISNSKLFPETLNTTLTVTITDMSPTSSKNSDNSQGFHSATTENFVPEISQRSLNAHTIHTSKNGKHKSSKNDGAASKSSSSIHLYKRSKISRTESSSPVLSPLKSSPSTHTHTSRGRNSSEASPNFISAISDLSATKMRYPSPAHSPASNVVSNVAVTNSSSNSSNSSNSDKSKSGKRKSSFDDQEVVPKKSKSKESSTTSNSTESSTNSTTKENHKPTSQQRSQHSTSGANVTSKYNQGTPTNGMTKSSLMMNHYQKGNNNNSQNDEGSQLVSEKSSFIANLPEPAPIETQITNTNHFLARAREHKHHADGLKNKMAKFEPYLRSGLSFFQAAFSMESSRREMSCRIYKDTSNLLQFAVTVVPNSSSNPECGGQERKIIALIIRLQAYLNHRLYRIRKAEANHLRKVIESEQAKLNASAMSVSSSTTTTSKPQAPSPHQSTWNKNSTRTPSPMSPTPSPAGSVSSQGSCELTGHMTSKVQNGTISSSSTPITSPSPSMVYVPQQTQSYSQRYFQLTGPMVKALHLWEQADAERKAFEGFFAVLDNACGPLSFHSEPPVIVRYMKYALRIVNLWK